MTAEKTNNVKDSFLSTTEEELLVTDFEFSFLCLSEAFRRWIVSCSQQVGGNEMGMLDALVLHVVRFRDTAKSISEISHFLSREDPSTVQYSLRKLESAGCVEKVAGLAKRETRYQVTEKGQEQTERYAEIRRDILIRILNSFTREPGYMEELMDKITVMAGVYDQAALRANHGARKKNQNAEEK
ncbi:MAG: winged helix DNA-binding protein [Gammaproteobacteria bacterium]|nr:winged helix DNA-binding protein [Gammaproteobacteria bacterium]